MKKKTLIGVFAHPDDEIIISGMIIQAIANNYDVHLISVTAGEAGTIRNKKFSNVNDMDIGSIRSKEYSKVCNQLKVTTSNILGYPDSGSSEWDEQSLHNDLLNIFNKTKPDYIVSFPLNGGNGHPDHIKTAELTTSAAQEFSKDNETQLMYLTSFKKNLLNKILWFLPKSKKRRIIEKYGIDNEEVDLTIKLRVLEHRKKIKLSLLHQTQFPDEKGRIYKLPKLVFRLVTRYENYKIVSDEIGDNYEGFNSI